MGTQKKKNVFSSIYELYRGTLEIRKNSLKKGAVN